MKFTEHRDSNILTVKSYEPGKVVINDQTITHSCYLNHHQLFDQWSCEHIDTLSPQHLEEILALKPEVIILGTGETQHFPPRAIFSFCAQKGIGLEVMANNVACRTFNVLTTEDREVVLALIFEPSDSSEQLAKEES